MKLTLKTWIVCSVLLGAIGVAIAWAWALNSQAYHTASAYIRQSPDVRTKIGGVQKITLCSFRLNKHKAYFYVLIEGEIATTKGTIRLDKKQEWRVVTLDLGEYQ